MTHYNLVPIIGWLLPGPAPISISGLGCRALVVDVSQKKWFDLTNNAAGDLDDLVDYLNDKRQGGAR